LGSIRKSVTFTHVPEQHICVKGSQGGEHTPDDPERHIVPSHD
jgi:hypothetical protein